MADSMMLGWVPALIDPWDRAPRAAALLTDLQ